MRLAGAFPRTRRFGVELDPVAAAMARARSGAAIAVASIAALPFAASSLDAVLSADVLCHRGVEPAAALAASPPVSGRGGVLVLNLPAYRWLFSGHDRAVDNVRRFGAARCGRCSRRRAMPASAPVIGTACCSRSWCCGASAIATAAAT